MSQAPDTRLAYPHQIASLIYDYIEAKPNALLEPNLVTRFERTIALLQRFTIQKEIGEFPVTRKNKQADPLTLKVTQFVSERVQLYEAWRDIGPFSELYGTVSIHIDNQKVYISGLYSFQREKFRGIGSGFVQLIVEICKQNNLKSLNLLSVSDSPGFYRKAHFTTGIRARDGEIDRLNTLGKKARACKNGDRMHLDANAAAFYDELIAKKPILYQV